MGICQTGGPGLGGTLNRLSSAFVVTALLAISLIFSGPARAEDPVDSTLPLELLLDESEPIDTDVSLNPSVGEVFNKNFNSAPDTSPADGIHDFFRQHSYFDWKESPPAYDHKLVDGA